MEAILQLIEPVLQLCPLFRRRDHPGQEMYDGAIAFDRIGIVASSRLRRCARFSNVKESESQLEIREKKIDANSIRLLYKVGVPGVLHE